MNVNFKPLLTLLGSVLVVFSASVASATNVIIAPGRETSFERDDYRLWSGNQTIAVPGNVDNSYACVGAGIHGLDSLRFKQQLAGPSGNITGALRGGADGAAVAKSVLAFIANGTGTFILALDTDMTAQGGGSSPRGQIYCKNTTLFGNFNTVNAANPVNFLEVTNISTQSVNILVVIRDYTGTEVGRVTRSLSGRTRQDIAIHDVSGAANVFGTVQVAHDGPIGGVTANVSKYKFAGGVLDITASEPLRTRIQ